MCRSLGVCVCLPSVCLVSTLPIPGDAQVPVLHDGVEVRDADHQPLRQGQPLLQKPSAAGEHLAGAHAGVLGEAPQGQALETLSNSRVLLPL